MKPAYLSQVHAESPYLLQLQAGFRRLAFVGALEAEFAEHHNRQFLRRMRGAFLVAMLLMLLFVVPDVLTLPDGVRQAVLGVRLGLLVPLISLAWLLSYLPAVRRHLQWLGGGITLVGGLGVNAIIWLAQREGVALPYEGIILATFFFYFLTGLRFRTAVLCGWLVFAGYVWVALDVGLAGEPLLYNLFFLATANLIGSVGCYFMEYAARENFLGQQLLREVAERDFLTGLLNRRAFNEQAQRVWRLALREGKALAVALLDVDYFKRYNDHYGHAAGDEALRAVAQVLQGYARRPLDMLARFGGEEFVGLWYDLSQAEAEQRLQALRQAIQAQALAHVGSEVAEVLTLSIGLAYVAWPAELSLAQALQQADSALYRAKEQGRNALCQ